MPALTQHLWLGKVDAEAAATTLAPKLRKSQTEVSNLLSEAVSLEVTPPPPPARVPQFSERRRRTAQCCAQ